MPKSKNKSSLSEENIKNEPFPYCHKYRVFLVNSHAEDWIEYVFHCDFENAKSSRCIQSLKERLNLGYRGFKIQNIRLLEANYNANSYQDFAKKRDLIVQRAMINKA
jgi:hypothetical protein